MTVPEIDFDELESKAGQFQRLIEERAATWEHQFEAGPGTVCSTSDAAFVFARNTLEREARERHADPARNEELREAICDWLRANDLDPNRVPSWARPILDTVDPENILITVPYWCQNDNDRPFLDRLTGSLAVQAETTLMKDGQFPTGQVLAWINGGSRPSGETE
jgi:hypothetical protein